jgi:2-desacetyl-2-hydroxyethyl bacteriochlorophyllide A dehydrogenase
MSSSGAVTMRAARLHGVRDLRVERLPRPEPDASELLVEIEACGVCPTDVRKYLIGLGDRGYPLNPGHEWVGRVTRVGADVTGWQVGDRVYGDTYAGYAEYATLAVGHGAWSHGPLRVDDALPLDRAVFVEPLADCIHAVAHQGRIGPGDHAVVIGAGQMGLQLVAVARAAGAKVLAVEPLGARRELALEFGADAAVAAESWEEHARDWAGGDRIDAVIVALGRADAVAPGLKALAPGGRLVLFAGFGERNVAPVDLNIVHYRELEIVGSEWVGTPPNARLECYRQALDLLSSGELRLERLVTRRCSLDTLVEAFADVQSLDALKIVLTP